MARYRFTATSSDGSHHDGTIDAATLSDARKMLTANGLMVRDLEEVAARPGIAPLETPRRSAAKSASSSDSGLPLPPLPARSTRPARREPNGALPRRGSSIPLLLSIIALVLALGAITYVVYRDPPWGRLNRYDFSTPEAAFISQLRIRANGDTRANDELLRKSEGKHFREQLDTLRVETYDLRARNKKLLFVEYQMDGQRHHDVFGMEKDPAQNYWKPWNNWRFELNNDSGVMEKVQQWLMTAPHNGFGPGGIMPPGGGGGGGVDW